MIGGEGSSMSLTIAYLAPQRRQAMESRPSCHMLSTTGLTRANESRQCSMRISEFRGPGCGSSELPHQPIIKGPQRVFRRGWRIFADANLGALGSISPCTLVRKKLLAQNAPDVEAIGTSTHNPAIAFSPPSATCQLSSLCFLPFISNLHLCINIPEWDPHTTKLIYQSLSQLFGSTTSGLRLVDDAL